MSEKEDHEADVELNRRAEAEAEAEAETHEHFDENDEEGEEQRPSPKPTSTKEALTLVAITTLASTIAVSIAFSNEYAGTPWMLGSMAIAYTTLGAITLYRLHTRGELAEQLTPRGGDLSLGALIAAVLYGVAMAVHLLITSPPSPRSLWIMKLYASLGDPTAENRHLLSGAVFLIAAAEELVWRGLAQRILVEKLGWLKGWLLQAALFGLAHTPTMLLLGDPRIGPNPLLTAAGLTYSLVWGRIALRTDRMPPAIFAHALFTWAVFEFPIWRP